MKIRKAEAEDIQALLDIYNYEVENGVATLDLDPKTYEEWEEWFYQHNIKNHPLYVAETEQSVPGNADMLEKEVVGYASFSPYREKQAYCSTVELSIYISPSYRRRGAASELMGFMLEWAAKEESIHTVVSVITSGNLASARLHEKFGFAFCGCVREVGMKFGRYLDIDHYSLCV